MKEFFRSLFATLIGLTLFVVGGFVLLFILAASMGPSKPTVPARAVLILDLNTNFTDAWRDPSPSDLIQRAAGQGTAESVPLHMAIQAIDRAANDGAVSGLFITGNIRPEGVGSGPAALKELREAIQRFRKASGKPVLAYNQFWTKRELYLCAGAGKVYANPMGLVDATGFASEIMFYGNAFKKYGIEVQVTRAGKYKSAVEPYMLDRMSEANREEVKTLLDDLWADWKRTVAQDRKLTEEAVQAIADTQGVLTPPEALKAGLVDKLAAYDEVLDELKSLTGKKASDVDYPQIALATYVKAAPEAVTSRNRIALVFAEGAIVDGSGGDGSVGGDALSRELRRLRLDKRVKAIVLRVNSPGGSVTASELIQRELVLARKEKPVVVSMGHLAASGGYWISAQANRIFAEPTTITGSIGVYGLLPNVKGLANGHGVTWDGVQTGRIAGAASLSRPRTAEELARAQGAVDWIYDVFLGKVAEGRKLSKERVHEIGQGRVWSGAAALKLGLVDEMGGLQDAVLHAAKLAKVEKDYRLEGPGEPKSALEKMLEALGSGRPSYTRSAAGGVQQELKRVWNGFEALNDPQGLYARMPYDLDLR